MGWWILIQNSGLLPEVFCNVVTSAFNGHAALGAFAGSSMIFALSHGVRRGCYTGDIGIGFGSVIHSETSVIIPEKQALLVIFEIFVDTFVICTSSVAVVLVTNVWQEPIDGMMFVQEALGRYFPYMHFFMPFFLFLVGYATINAYYSVGLTGKSEVCAFFKELLLSFYNQHSNSIFHDTHSIFHKSNSMV